MTVTLTLCALLIEAVVGYPDRLVRSIGHPVTWIGRLIGVLERHFNSDTAEPVQRRTFGIITLFLVVSIVALVAFVIERGLLLLPFGLAGVGFLASTLIAQRSLHEHVAGVADALEKAGAEGGRQAVAHIVGRDTEALDEAGVARAAIESLAENFSDGVVAPVLWMLIAGLPGAAVYKAINTADSMIGHRTSRYQAFGWAAARVDDLVNLPASRLSALLIIAAAAVTKRLQHRRRGGRCGATLVVTAPRTPAIRRRRWQERSGSRSRGRATTAASGSTTRSWETAVAPPRRAIFGLPSDFTVAPTVS